MVWIRTYSKYIDDYYNIKKFNDDMFKITYCKTPVKRAGFEKEKKFVASRDKNKKKLTNNIARARTRIFEYAICNEFEYFITLTINGDYLDRYNLKEYIKKLGQFIRDYRKKYEVNIQYLLIPEKHKDGAWHCHGLIKGIPERQLVKNEHGYLDWPDYRNRFGFCSIDEIKNQVAVSKYITKYIRKSFDTGKGVTDKESKLYYCSRDLKKPQKIKEGTMYSFEHEQIPFTYENDYVRTAFLNKEECEQVLSILDDVDNWHFSC